MFNEIDEKKKLLDSKRPLSIQALNNLKKYFDIELTYNSNAIEEINRVVIIIIKIYSIQ